MAKKRRRRRVDEASSEGSTSSQTLTERESPSPQQVEESTGISAVVGQAAEVEEEEDEEEEEEQEQESGIRGVVMPPLPSELGMNAVKTAQVGHVVMCRFLAEVNVVILSMFCCTVGFSENLFDPVVATLYAEMQRMFADAARLDLKRYQIGRLRPAHSRSCAQTDTLLH